MQGAGFPRRVLFETGYGPSGLPHIGTFGEVARTTMVRHAFRVLTEDKVKTRLLCFSDDMDGMRKVPDNVPNQDMLRAASRQAADPGSGPVRQRVSVSFGAAQQCEAAALSSTASASTTSSPRATEYYKAGRFDADAAARCSNASTPVMEIMLPSLRRGADADLFAVPADPPEDRRRHAGADRGAQASRPARSSGATPTAASASRRRSPAAMSSCNGSPTGRCAGQRSASITRCPART